MFFKNKSGGDRWLIVGLGNPESKYDNTRHNIGFAAVDYMAEKLGVSFNKKKFNAIYADTIWGDNKVLLVKPLTYMNNSGEAVAEFASFFKIPPERIIVVFDDISLDVSKIRIRRKGSAGGHNGIKSIIAHAGTQNFMRIKVGVGEKPSGWDLADYVLGHFSEEDTSKIKEVMPDILQAAVFMMQGDVDKAMNDYNAKK